MDVNKLIKEIEAGIKQSIEAVKEKADELTEEGKKQYRLFDLKSGRQKQSAAVGEKLHELVSGKKMTVSDKALKTLLASLARTIAEIDKLEGKKVQAIKRKAGTKPRVKPAPQSKKKSAVKKSIN